MKSLFKTKKVLLSFLFIFLSVYINATTFTFLQEEQEHSSYKLYSGKVLDAETQKPIALAHISIDETNIVSKAFLHRKISVSVLGYTTKTILLPQLTEDNIILLSKSVIELTEVNIKTLKNIDNLIEDIFDKKGDNYLDNHAVMTAFYRETIKRRNKNVSLSEAIVNIYKTPYNSDNKDVLKFHKTRKQTNYTRLDTLVFKVFSFSHSTNENNTIVHVINFKQKENVTDLLYKGQLFIDYKNKILTRAIFSLNIDNKNIASNWFTKMKPSHTTVLPTKATYKVNYLEKNGRWYYGYSHLDLGFKINSKKKLFNSNYSMSCEMAVTDWEKNNMQDMPKYKDRIKTSVIMNDYSVGFSDPDFWGEYNIIEPDKSIEMAIKKIQKQLKKTKKSDKTVSSL